MSGFGFGFGFGVSGASLISSGGDAGGGEDVWTQPAGSPLTLANGDEVTLTHPTVTNEKIAFAAGKYISQNGIVNNSIDFDVGDASLYTYDAAKAEFVGGVVKLKDIGGGTESATTYASIARVSATVANATIDGTAGTGTSSPGEYDNSWGVEYIFSGDLSGVVGKMFLGQNNGGAGTVIIDLGKQLYVSKVRVGTGYTDNGKISPGTMKWSTDNSSYNSGTAFTTQSTNVRNTYTDITVGATIRYIKFELTAAQYNTISMHKVQVYKQAANYTTSEYVPVSTKDTAQISLSGVIDINSITNTITTPASTAVKMLVSFDGRVTWKKWNGSAWATHSGGLTNIGTGNTPAEVATGLTNLTITTETSLDFAWGLYTTDATATPNVSELDVNYDAEGYYDPVAVAAIGGSAPIGVRRLTPTTTKFKNQSGSSAQLFLTAITPG